MASISRNIQGKDQEKTKKRHLCTTGQKGNEDVDDIGSDAYVIGNLIDELYLLEDLISYVDSNPAAEVARYDLIKGLDIVRRPLTLSDSL